jgi:glycosyltransferase involved in cell wall biosynthesis
LATSLQFSIITPSFNQASYIEANILSVLHQDYPNIEHIIIDGGSNDDTIKILKKYPHLKWRSEPDSGQSNALNKGFSFATGEIIGWLNSDDTYRQNVLKKVNEVFSDQNVMIVYGDGYEIDEKGNEIRPMFSRGMTVEDFIKYWTWAYEYVQPSFFFRRQVFQEVGYLDESLNYVMDHEFFLRLLLKYNFQHLPHALSNLRLHNESKTGKGIQNVISPWIWELHHVSLKYWGHPWQLRYYKYCFSFIGALFLSFFKNVFFMRGSKTRHALKRFLDLP